MRKYKEDVNDTPQEYARSFLDGSYGEDYSWTEIIEEVNLYFDKEYPITEKIFKDLTGITPDEYEVIRAKGKRTRELNDKIDDLDWDIDSISDMLDDGKVRMVDSRDALIELKIELQQQRDALKSERDNL